MAKIMTQLDMLSKIVMGVGARSVNVVGVGCAYPYESKFEALYNEEVGKIEIVNGGTVIYIGRMGKRIDLTRSKAAERTIPAQEKTKGITINEDTTISRGKATKLPTTGGKGKGKRSISDRKITIRDPNVPLWAWGFCAAVHVFLEDSHVTTLSGSGTAVPPEVTPSTDAQTQIDASGTDAQTDGATV
uniref:Integrase core domain containing protein n=1 Tax=Solanum tuberosum TaxID=4113 RepID=M1DBK7_SOLTU